VKAGLLPRLSDDVIAVYVEATAGETEARLLNSLRKRCVALPDNLTLKTTLAALRRGQGIPVGKKVVIILDQFEQWLHAKKQEQDSELVQALRQCDGNRVQCIVMVRDDFWMAVIRFMRELEVRLLEGQNSAAVDLFDTDHARRVLAAFGRAFGKLPENPGDTSKDQKEFLTQAVSGLAQEGKIICVRLALFAEMMKGKAWTPASLKAVGGTEGVGVTFLEETFSADTAPPEHRYHQKAARADLKILLPETGSDIKGHMRSYAELLEASGYGSRPKDFDDLIRILDNEIRLITPTDPEGKDANSDSVLQTKPGQKYYQLTHDYLVHSIREWLTRKQKETRRGRAELLLADRAAVWNARPENRQLPSLVQLFTIRWWTQKKNWTPPQKKMMARAGKYHALRGMTLGLLLAVAAATGLAIREQVVEQRKATHAAGLVQRLLDADTAQVPGVIGEMAEYRQWTDPVLRQEIAKAADRSRQKLHASLALLPVDASQIDYLSEQLLTCTLEQFPIVREALLPHKADVMEKLWRVEQDDAQDTAQRFRAAAALAEYAPDDERWEETAPFVAQHLTTAISSVNLGQWRQVLQPASKSLVGPLTRLHAERSRSEKQREAAAFVMSGYLRDEPLKLADAILTADELAEYAPLVDALKPHAATVTQPLLHEMQAIMPVHLAKTNPPVALNSEGKFSTAEQKLRDAHWKRQALAAVTLVQLGHGDAVWPLLKFSPDPSLRSFIIIYLGKLGTNHNTLAGRLEVESDVSIRRALIQSLGGLDSTRIPTADRRRIAERLQRLYVHDPDPGVHGSASWSLRQWGVSLPQLPIGEPVLPDGRWNGIRRWYVDGQGQTMIMLPLSAAGSNKQTAQGIAIATHEVTVADYRRFKTEPFPERSISPTDDCPVYNMSWQYAAEYCNWYSKQERIPEAQWVYGTDGKGGLKIKGNSSKLYGYRLPTNAEWEFACRAGAKGSYSFGEPITLLKHYGWYAGNSSGHSHPVESLLPNEAGLFDMHGNSWEWTHESALRGGSFINQPKLIRVDYSWGGGGGLRFDFSFRLARTLPIGFD